MVTGSISGLKSVQPTVVQAPTSNSVLTCRVKGMGDKDGVLEGAADRETGIGDAEGGSVGVGETDSVTDADGSPVKDGDADIDGGADIEGVADTDIEAVADTDIEAVDVRVAVAEVEVVGDSEGDVLGNAVGDSVDDNVCDGDSLADGVAE